MTELKRAIGLMSGTSMDGIDIALLETDGENCVKRGVAGFAGYDAVFRRKIETSLQDAKQIVDRQERPAGLRDLEREITEHHAEAVSDFLSLNKIAKESIDLIGFHGQTVLHKPDVGLTVQLGNGGFLASMTGIPVVYDMRANDMLHGGQGAPLVPVYHQALAAGIPKERSGDRPVVFVNIGGISNVTIIARGKPPVAFDTGPGNALIDQWVTDQAGIAYDAGGAIASEGQIIERVIQLYLSKPFFSQKPPKSLDRNDFTLAQLGNPELADGARTLARVTATAILEAAKFSETKPGLWVICGGGRKNAAIMADLTEGAAQVGAQVIPSEDIGLDGDSMEAEAWAYLAVRAEKGLPLTFPTTTGCRMPASGGILVKPSA